jgi:hypothetical protein
MRHSKPRYQLSRPAVVKAMSRPHPPEPLARPHTHPLTTLTEGETRVIVRKLGRPRTVGVHRKNVYAVRVGVDEDVDAGAVPVSLHRLYTSSTSGWR